MGDVATVIQKLATASALRSVMRKLLAYRLRNMKNAGATSHVILRSESISCCSDAVSGFPPRVRQPNTTRVICVEGILACRDPVETSSHTRTVHTRLHAVHDIPVAVHRIFRCNDVPDVIPLRSAMDCCSAPSTTLQCVTYASQPCEFRCCNPQFGSSACDQPNRRQRARHGCANYRWHPPDH